MEGSKDWFGATVTDLSPSPRRHVFSSPVLPLCPTPRRLRLRPLSLTVVGLLVEPEHDRARFQEPHVSLFPR